MRHSDRRAIGGEKAHKEGTGKEASIAKDSSEKNDGKFGSAEIVPRLLRPG